MLDLHNLTEEEKEQKQLELLLKSEESIAKKQAQKLELLGEEVKEGITAATRYFPNFPKENVIFKDLNLIFADCTLSSKIISFISKSLDFRDGYVLAPEARGFILGPSLALFTGSGFIPVRKLWKLPPFETVQSTSYKTEYSTDSLEVDTVSFWKFENKKVLIYDDILATGGTISAIVTMLEGFVEKENIYVACLTSVAGLGGEQALIDAGIPKENILIVA